MGNALTNLASKTVKAGADAAAKKAGKAVSDGVKTAKKKAAITVTQRVLFEQKHDENYYSTRIMELVNRSDELRSLISKLNKEIDRLEDRLANTFVLSFSKKSEIREDIKIILWKEYAIYEYLQLLSDVVDRPRQLGREERRFLSTFGNYLDEMLNDSKLKQILAARTFNDNSWKYVARKHGGEIEHCVRCSFEDLFD